MYWISYDLFVIVKNNDLCYHLKKFRRIKRVMDHSYFKIKLYYSFYSQLSARTATFLPESGPNCR